MARMDPARWQRVQELFHEAQARPSAERSVFLDDACDDPELRAEVDALLEATPVGETTFLDPPSRLMEPSTDPETSALGTLLGRNLGDCELKELIGEGGMGAVFEAIQSPWNRRVAVKVLRGLPSAESRRRFDFEARVLSTLQHPSIAQIHATGLHTDTGMGIGIPYFVMEFVPDAQRITDYAKVNDLDVGERCKLMESVCAGVHHGHLKGVIHRDLKPGNILVDGSGRAKVIDFGVARTTDGAIDRSFATRAGMVLGTPAYMSPEQLDGATTDVDARADVYALGVVLYELLCGERPYEVSSTGWGDAVKQIRENPIPRASLKCREAKGDLDTIVQKALAKDRDQRYASAFALEDDLRRWQQGLPVTARPLTLGYQLRTFARRNRALVASAAIIVLVVVAAAIVSIAMALKAQRRAEEAEHLVELGRELSVWVSDDLQRRLAELPGSTQLRRELLERVLTWLDGIRETAGDSKKLMNTVARSYAVVASIEGSASTGLADPRRALATIDKALDILADQRSSSPDDPVLRLQYAQALSDRTEYMFDTADWAECLEAMDEIRELVKPLFDHPELGDSARIVDAGCVYQEAFTLGRNGDWKAAAEGIGRARQLLPDPDPAAGPAAWRLHIRWDLQRLNMIWDGGDGETARAIWRTVEPRMRAIAAHDKTGVNARVTHSLAERVTADFLHYEDKQSEEALRHYQKAIDLLEPLHRVDKKQMGHAHNIALLHSRCVDALIGLNEFDRARPHAEKNLHLQRQMTAAAPESAIGLQNLRIAVSHVASVMIAQGDLEAAQPRVEEAMELARKFSTVNEGPEPQRALAEAFADLARLHTKRDKLREARSAWAESKRILEGVEDRYPGTWGIKDQIEKVTRFLADCDAALADRQNQ